MAGLSATGFEAKTLDDIIVELTARLKQAYGNDVDLTANEPLGMAQGIWGEREAEIWDLLQLVYRSHDPSSAGGAALTALSALTGTIREPAQPSSVVATLVGTAGTLVASGSQASTLNARVKFATSAAATITAVTAWATATAYTVGTIRTRSSNVYRCTVAGTSSGGPSGTGSSIADGTATWAFMGAGTGAIDVATLSVDDGPLLAPAGTLTVIETPVGGWSGVYNFLDADLGQLEESDPALRLRREQELQGSGLATLASIRAAVLRSDVAITAVTVFENTTLTTDADGVPGKAIEVLVQGGDDTVVRNAVFNAKPAGIQAYGLNTATVTDAQGGLHSIGFSRPAEILIYVTYDLLVDATVYPIDGDAQVKAAAVAYGDTSAAGKNVVSSQMSTIAMSKVPGILDSTAFIGTAPFPGGTGYVVINRRQIAVYDTSRISVAATPGTP